MVTNVSLPSLSSLAFKASIVFWRLAITSIWDPTSVSSQDIFDSNSISLFDLCDLRDKSVDVARDVFATESKDCT